MNEAIIAATVDIIEQLLGHDSPQPEVIAALERVLAGRRREAGMVDWMEPAQSAARKIMTLFGWSQEPSNEPGDRQRDRVAFIVQQAIDASGGRIQGLREAAEIVRGQIYRTCYRTWPQLGDGDRANDSEIVRHCDWLATAILAAIPSPSPPQSVKQSPQHLFDGKSELDAAQIAFETVVYVTDERYNIRDEMRFRLRAAIAALDALRARDSS